MSTTLVCLGLGYCAQHYAHEFGARFDRIVGTTRDLSSISAHSRESGNPGATAPLPKDLGPRFRGDERKIDMLEFDGRTASPELLAAIAAANALLISAAPDETGDPVLAVLGDALLEAPRLSSIVYLSTVGVYGDHDGAWVDETTPTRAAGTRGYDRVVAETAWRTLGEKRAPAVAILRLAGIYGPGQNALVNVRSGRARRIVKPGQVFNRIHVADIAQAIDAAFRLNADGAFNLADDLPTAPGDPIVFAAELLGVPPPAEIPFAEAQKTMSPLAVSFYSESRRVRNDKLKRELGVTLRYPTYREGLMALYAQMKRVNS